MVTHARAFADNVAARTQNRVSFELVFPETAALQSGFHFPWAAQQLAQNKVQISQIGTGQLSRHSRVLGLFDLPFLFRDHQHAAAVLDGALGEEIRKTAALQSGKIRPLSFTYSGGFRIVASKSRIARIGDFANLTASSVRSIEDRAGDDSDKSLPILRDESMKSFGVKIAPFQSKMVSESELFRTGVINVSEDHYGHYTGIFSREGLIPGTMKFFLETNHSLFLTSIVANEEFYQSLSPEDRGVLLEEAQALAVKERVDSILSDQKAKRWLEVSGFGVDVPSPALLAAMKERSEPTYAQFKGAFGDLPEKIRAFGGQNDSMKISMSRDR